MMLLTEEIRKKLPEIGETSELKREEVKVPLKLFNPCGSWTWYVTEFDGEDLFFGYVDGDFPELGYFSLRELEGVTLPFGLKIERDMHWNDNTTLAEVMA